MHIVKIQTAAVAAATAAVVLVHNVGAFVVNNACSPSRLVVPRGRGVPHRQGSSHRGEDRMLITRAGATPTLFCSSSSSSSSTGFIRSAFCSRPPPAVSGSFSASSFSSSSRPRRLSLLTAPSPRGVAAAVYTTSRGRGTATRLMSMGPSGGGRGGKGESTLNRALGTVVYLLPMLDGLEYGHDLFRAVPMLGNVVHAVLAPALGIWDNVPFMPLVMFVILQISVRRQRTSRFIRFNVQQAILVDILTVVLGLLGTAAGYVIPDGEQFMTNFSFYCLVGAVAYAVAETARGKVANQIPLISAAAEIQLGPS